MMCVVDQGFCRMVMLYSAAAHAKSKVSLETCVVVFGKRCGAHAGAAVNVPPAVPEAAPAPVPAETPAAPLSAAGLKACKECGAVEAGRFCGNCGAML